MMQPAHARRGFTLLEMVISIGLFITVMAMTFAFYRRSLEIKENGTTQSTRVQLARVVLATIADEIRQASGFLPGYGPGVFGLRDAVEINTVVIPDRKLTERRNIRDKQLPGQFDVQQIRYYIAWDEQNVDTNGNPRALGLVRRANRTYLRDVVFDENAPNAEQAELAWKEELYAPEIKYLEVLYFDGARWWDTWELEQGNTLPQIVRVTVGFVPELPEETELEIVDEDFLQQEEDIEPLPEDRYSIFIRIPQADVFFGSRMTRQASAFSEASAGAGL